MDSLQLISTADGSHSLLNTTLQETYHSVHGALRESRHVFLDNGLIEFQKRNPGKNIRVLEIGFGTGLNAILALLHSRGLLETVYYESWEKEPLTEDIVKQLNYGEMLDEANAFAGVHAAPWNHAAAFHPAFTIMKVLGNILEDPIASSFDVIYYDAFAPSRQPELWTIEILKKVTDVLRPGGIWVTYCAKGQVKRDLASLGLTVETLPGPPGKKEMTRATRPIK